MMWFDDGGVYGVVGVCDVLMDDDGDDIDEEGDEEGDVRDMDDDENEYKVTYDMCHEDDEDGMVMEMQM